MGKPGMDQAEKFFKDAIFEPAGGVSPDDPSRRPPRLPTRDDLPYLEERMNPTPLPSNADMRAADPSSAFFPQQPGDNPWYAISGFGGAAPRGITGSTPPDIRQARTDYLTQQGQPTDATLGIPYTQSALQPTMPGATAGADMRNDAPPGGLLDPGAWASLQRMFGFGR
jgi:hypothetical protein